MPTFQEQQTFPLFAYVAALAVPALTLALGLIPDMPLVPLFAIGSLTLCVCLVVANLLFMKTIVTEEALEVRFGYALTMYRKSFALREIRLESPVTYRPLRDGGGWGIRWGRFDGRSCRFLTARGNRGVLFNAGELFIVGSQDPDALAQALAESGCLRLGNSPVTPT